MESILWINEFDALKCPGPHARLTDEISVYVLPNSVGTENDANPFFAEIERGIPSKCKSTACIYYCVPANCTRRPMNQRTTLLCCALCVVCVYMHHHQSQHILALNSYWRYTFGLLAMNVIDTAFLEIRHPQVTK